MPKGKLYSTKEMEKIILLHNDGVSVSEIAETVHRSPKALSNFISRMKKKRLITAPDSGKIVIPEGVREKQLCDFTYEDIIRYMYKSGFRIEDNKLVHYTKTPIKIENLI